MAKILVVEDEAALREDIVATLSYEGYETIAASDGVEGVNLAIVHQPDLIVCDIMMPRLDGYGVLFNVRANSALQLTPFLFLTAKISQEDFRRGMDLGADDYLTKPIELDALLRAIEARLDRQAAQDKERQEKIDVFRNLLHHEREQRLLQAKFASMLAHDFRNQLTVILSASSLVRDFGDRLDAESRRRHLNHVESASRLLLQMLDDMLLLAQMEVGKFYLNVETLNVNEFIQTIVNEFQIATGTTHQVQFKSTFDKSLHSDVRLLRQICANLISNAIKYSPLGSTVNVTLHDHEGKLALVVKDQGIGIPLADQARLFESFERGSNVGKIVGTGLGLAVVKRAVDVHLGTIHVESQVGAGTTFTVLIPNMQSGI